MQNAISREAYTGRLDSGKGKQNHRSFKNKQANKQKTVRFSRKIKPDF